MRRRQKECAKQTGAPIRVHLWEKSLALRLLGWVCLCGKVDSSMDWRRLGIAVSMVLACASLAVAAPITLTIDPSTSTPAQGSSVDVTIRVNVVDQDPADGFIVDLAGYSFSLAYNPQVLQLQQLTDVVDGGFLGGGNPTGNFTGPNSLSPPLLIGDSLNFPLPGVTGSGIL